MSCQLPLLALFQDIVTVRKLLFLDHHSGDNEVTEGITGKVSLSVEFTVVDHCRSNHLSPCRTLPQVSLSVEFTVVDHCRSKPYLLVLLFLKVKQDRKSLSWVPLDSQLPLAMCFCFEIGTKPIKTCLLI